MKTKIFATVAIAASLVILVLVSCGQSHSVATRLTSAEEALSEGDISLAREACDKLLADSAEMTAEELGRMSILYMRLSDKADDLGAVNAAADCFRRAFERNHDAATEFYRSQSVDNDRYIMILSSIVRSLDNPGEILPDEPYPGDDSGLVIDTVAIDSVM